MMRCGVQGVSTECIYSLSQAFWRHCIDVVPGFVPLYACYLHYRSKV